MSEKPEQIQPAELPIILPTPDLRVCGFALHEGELLVAGNGDRRVGRMVLARQELAHVEENPIATTRQKADALWELAMATHDVERQRDIPGSTSHRDSDPLFERALVLYGEGLQDERVASQLSELAFWRSEEKNYSQAEPLYDIAVDICAKDQGWYYAYVIAGRADLYFATQRMKQAEAEYRRALPIARATNSNVGWVGGAHLLRKIAACCAAQGRVVAAEEAITAAIAEESAAMGVAYWEVLDMRDDYAQLLRQMGRLAAAIAEESAVLEALRCQIADLTPPDNRIVMATQRIEAIERRQG